MNGFFLIRPLFPIKGENYGILAVGLRVRDSENDTFGTSGVINYPLPTNIRVHFKDLSEQFLGDADAGIVRYQ